jgi:hypothetical protein
MKTSEMLPPSKYISKTDVGDREVTVTIKTLQHEQVGPSAQDTKFVLYFHEARKGMPLNAGSIRQLEAAFGDDSDYWVGQRVILWVDQSVQFQGRTVGGLRLRPVKAAAPRGGSVFSQPAAPAHRPSQPLGISAGREAAASSDAAFNDDIPF